MGGLWSAPSLQSGPSPVFAPISRCASPACPVAARQADRPAARQSGWPACWPAEGIPKPKKVGLPRPQRGTATLKGLGPGASLTRGAPPHAALAIIIPTVTIEIFGSSGHSRTARSAVPGPTVQAHSMNAATIGGSPPCGWMERFALYPNGPYHRPLPAAPHRYQRVRAASSSLLAATQSAVPSDRISFFQNGARDFR